MSRINSMASLPLHNISEPFQRIIEKSYVSFYLASKDGEENPDINEIAPNIIEQGCRMLWALRRSLLLGTQQTVPKLLETFISPLLEYRAKVYFSVTKVKCYQLERIQRTAVRLISQLGGFNYLDRHQKQILITLECHCSRMDMVISYCALNYSIFQQYEQFSNHQEQLRS